MSVVVGKFAIPRTDTASDRRGKREGRGVGGIAGIATCASLVSLTLQSSIGTTPILPYLAVQGTTIRNMQSEYMGTIHYNTHGHRGRATPGLQLAMGLKEDACMQRSV